MIYLYSNTYYYRKERNVASTARKIFSSTRAENVNRRNLLSFGRCERPLWLVILAKEYLTHGSK